MMIIGQAVWQYHRFNQSYRDVREQLLYRGIDVSHETIRSWCYKFGKKFEKVIKKKQRKVTDKWHLDEMTMKVNGEYFILWRWHRRQGIKPGNLIRTSFHKSLKLDGILESLFCIHMVSFKLLTLLM